MNIKIKEGSDFQRLLSILQTEKKDSELIAKYKKEFDELDRELRDSQVGRIQKDKYVGKEGEKKKVTAVRVPVAFANKIANTTVAFEFGKPVIITPEEQNELSDQVLLEWKNSRLDYKIQQAKLLQRKETQSAIVFSFKDLKQGYFNRKLGANSNRAISCKVLDSDSGEFYPFFDESGDMVYFIHEFKTKTYDENYKPVTTNNVWVYDDTTLTKVKKDGGNLWQVEPQIKHGFSKIPAVYMSQEKPEHFLVKEAIDRIEVALSKLGNANDYSGHPILFIEGEVYGLPDKNADGKVMKTKTEYEEGKKIQGGDAKFLTHDNAPEAVKLEIETLEKYIYAMSSTPDISFANLKSVGNISEATLELMFLDCELKKLMNEGQNRTDVERCLNIIVSGIITTSKVAYSSLAQSTIFNIVFPSVLPNNFTEKVGTLATAVTAGLMSKELAIELIGEADDLEYELKKIEEEKANVVEPTEPILTE